MPGALEVISGRSRRGADRATQDRRAIREEARQRFREALQRLAGLQTELAARREGLPLSRGPRPCYPRECESTDGRQRR